MLRTTYYYVLRKTYYYVLRTTTHCVIRTTTYYLQRTTTNCVLRTTTYYNQPAPSDLLRNLLALPARLGGIALTNPSVQANDEFQASLLVTRPLKTAITNQATAYTYDIMSEQINAKEAGDRQ